MRLRKYLPVERMGKSRVLPASFRSGAEFSAPKIDLRSICAPVRDQKDQDCTGFALSELMYSLRKAMNKDDVLFSPEEIYYEERLRENDVNQDNGAYIPDGLWVLQNIGATPEKDDVYTGDFRHPPSQKALEDAKAYRIAGWQEVPRYQGEPMAALSQVFDEFGKRNCLVAGIVVTQEIEESHNGYCPMPGPNSQILGGHAVLFCGKIDNAAAPGGGFVIWQNSWSTAYGDKGFGYLPYAFVADPNLTQGIWKAWL